MGTGNGVAVVHADDLQNSRLEIIFYITLLITAIQAGYVFWDLVTLLPGSERLFNLSGPNTVVATGELSTVYLGFLATYTGYKEFLKWTKKADTESGIPQEQVKRFKRGEIIVVFWVLLLVVALVLKAQHLIPRLPYELNRMAVQACVVLLGSWGSSQMRQSRKKDKAEQAELVTDHAEAIKTYCAANKYINNKSCRELTGLSQHQVALLLKRLKDEGRMGSDGSGRNVRYFWIE